MPDRPNRNKDSSLVTVLATSDASRIAVAKSLLSSEGIKYHIKGEQIQSLFGLGTLVPVNPITGPVEIQVSRDDAEAGRELLGELTKDESEGGC